MPCLDVIMIAFFPRNISSLLARKARVNTEQVLPGHPTILLKSNKFNMAAVSVKRSIVPDKTAEISRRHHWFPNEMTPEKRAKKFHTDDASLLRSGSAYLMKQISTNQRN